MLTINKDHYSYLKVHKYLKYHHLEFELPNSSNDGFVTKLMRIYATIMPSADRSANKKHKKGQSVWKRFLAKSKIR